MGSTNRNELFSHKIDWVTVALYCAIVFWGWLNIYAVTYDPEASMSIFNLNSDLGPVYAGRQLTVYRRCISLSLWHPHRGHALL